MGCGFIIPILYLHDNKGLQAASDVWQTRDAYAKAVCDGVCK